jgi:hypothetical protein
MSELYTIEKKVPIRKSPFCRWTKLSTDMKPADSVLVANSNEAMGLRTALKRLGKKCRTSIEQAGRDERRVWVITHKGCTS